MGEEGGSGVRRVRCRRQSRGREALGVRARAPAAGAARGCCGLCHMFTRRMRTRRMRPRARSHVYERHHHAHADAAAGRCVAKGAGHDALRGRKGGGHDAEQGCGEGLGRCQRGEHEALWRRGRTGEAVSAASCAERAHARLPPLRRAAPSPPPALPSNACVPPPPAPCRHPPCAPSGIALGSRRRWQTRRGRTPPATWPPPAQSGPLGGAATAGTPRRRRRQGWRQTCRARSARAAAAPAAGWRPWR